MPDFSISENIRPFSKNERKCVSVVFTIVGNESVCKTNKKAYLVVILVIYEI